MEENRTRPYLFQHSPFGLNGRSHTKWFGEFWLKKNVVKNRVKSFADRFWLRGSGAFWLLWIDCPSLRDLRMLRIASIRRAADIISLIEAVMSVKSQELSQLKKKSKAWMSQTSRFFHDDNETESLYYVESWKECQNVGPFSIINWNWNKTIQIILRPLSLAQIEEIISSRRPKSANFASGNQRIRYCREWTR